jgi:small subunit ribosomal protein S1
VTGKVKTVDPRGAEIQLNDDVTGYLRASELTRDRVEDARNDPEGRRRSRSHDHQRRPQDAFDPVVDQGQGQRRQQEAMQRISSTNERENAGTTSLGALLRAKLDGGSKE